MCSKRAKIFGTPRILHCKHTSWDNECFRSVEGRGKSKSYAKEKGKKDWAKKRQKVFFSFLLLLLFPPIQQRDCCPGVKERKEGRNTSLNMPIRMEEERERDSSLEWCLGARHALADDAPLRENPPSGCKRRGRHHSRRRMNN